MSLKPGELLCGEGFAGSSEERRVHVSMDNKCSDAAVCSGPCRKARPSPREECPMVFISKYVF